MRIAFYKAKHGDWVDWVVAAATFSKYSHCELVFDNNVCASASARDRGVRVKTIDLSTGHWDIYEVNGDYNEDEILNWFLQRLDRKYDWFGSFFSLFNIDFTHNSRKYCSECCGLMLRVSPCLPPNRLRNRLLKMGIISEHT